MKKLLHERLREWAINRSPLTAATSDYGIDMFSSLSMKSSDLFKAIANEIEKYYIPRPRFEDGEPVQDSDLIEIGECAVCCVYMDGSWLFNPDKYEDERNPKPWDEQEGRQCNFIKRPEPKVLDAEGVEIKVGDTVWGKYSGVEHEVIGFDSCYGLLCVSIRNVETGSTGGSSPNLLTHREPDSLEKLLVDLRGAADFIPSKEYLKHLADRLTAIMERDA